MNDLSNVTVDINKGFISGPLNRDTVSCFERNYHQNLLEQSNKKTVALDLANITSVDTAGLAWLLLLLETAISIDCQLSFINLPDDLLKLAKLSAVDTFITKNA